MSFMVRLFRCWLRLLLQPCPSARPGVARARKITEDLRRKNGRFIPQRKKIKTHENRFSDAKAVIFLVPREGWNL
jgi:hypothetical protein